MDLTSLAFWEAGTLNGWVTVALAVGTFLAYLLAYHTYGRWLAKKIFKLDPAATVPSVELQDDVDYVPSKKVVVFGHHFTSIAGTGPIVGPAIGVIWGWLPALIWVVVGSIFMGAVHDFGALVVSLRNKGQSIGEVCAKLVNPRVRILFSLIIFFLLLIVIAIFCRVIAMTFEKSPHAVIPVWLEIPIAMALGYMIYKRGMNAWIGGVLAVVLMYATVVLGAYVPIPLHEWFAAAGLGEQGGHAALMVTWTVLLLIYVYFASTVPVQKLLQPRDYINAYQLFIAMGLLIAGVLVARPAIVAPAINTADVQAPGGLWPLLFITIACGALSGFHSLVASGTSPKQIRSELDARSVGYGSMLTEGMLAVLVILACCAGIGLAANGGDATALWGQKYASWKVARGGALGVFLTGSSEMLTSYGIPIHIAAAIMGVFVASFAGTTLDTATRLQRYLVGELAKTCKLKWMANAKVATAVAVVTAGALALTPPPGKVPGEGGLILWPLFGTVNQLLGGLVLLAVTIYLAKRKSHWAVTAIPMVFMIVMTGWALVELLGRFAIGKDQNHLLFAIGLIIFLLEIWMIIESVIVFARTLSGRQGPGEQAKPQTPPADA
jgi:carbon starvation protein